MTTNKTDQLIDLLYRIQSKPWKYIGLNPENIIPFIDALNLTSQALGLAKDVKIYELVLKDKGIANSSNHPFYEFKEQGKTDEEAIQAFLATEIESWKRAGDTSTEPRI